MAVLVAFVMGAVQVSPFTFLDYLPELVQRTSEIVHFAHLAHQEVGELLPVVA